MKIIGLAGWSGAGKTTLIVRLLPALRARGLTVSTLKHAHHRFDVDHPGKDSFEHRLAGAQEVLVASGQRWALMHELRGAAEPPLSFLLDKMSPVDLIVIEGFKHDPHPKIEVHRVANAKPLLHPSDPDIVAIATDATERFPTLDQAHLGDAEAIADIVQRHARPVAEIAARLRDAGA